MDRIYCISKSVGLHLVKSNTKNIILKHQSSLKKILISEDDPRYISRSPKLDQLKTSSKENTTKETIFTGSVPELQETSKSSSSNFSI